MAMNTGAEAVETALKAARRWAYDVKGIEPNKAEIIAFNGVLSVMAAFNFSTSPKSILRKPSNNGPYPL
jgi:acetylornithine/succinyldiaminopimelate/putrescine aminotransferase